jgi:hypothetical protein
MPALKTLIEPRTKACFRSMAKARGLSESELLRAVILTVTGEDGDNTDKPIEPDAEKADTTRMTVRMPRFLMEAATARSRVKGMAPSRWVAALVQSNLTCQPVMTDDELMGLLAANRQLAAIGRNINQIARALHDAPHETERVKIEQLAQLRDAILKQRAAVRALVRASQNSWVADIWR